MRKQSLPSLSLTRDPNGCDSFRNVGGDHWREGELEIVIACGACLFVGFGPRGNQPTPDGVGSPRRRSRERWVHAGLALSEKPLLSETAENGGDVERRQQELRIAATVCVADVVSMLGSGMTVRVGSVVFWRGWASRPSKCR